MFAGDDDSPGQLDGESFRRPQGMAVDESDNVDVADTRNQRIVKLAPGPQP